MRSNILYLESVAGIAGDMFAASFVDAGLVSTNELEGIPELLNLPGVTVEVTQVSKATLKATHIHVGWSHEGWKHNFPGGAPAKTVAAESPPASTPVLPAASQKNWKIKPQSSLHHHTHDHSHDHNHAHTHHDNSSVLEGHWHTHYVDLKLFLERSRLDVESKALALRILKHLAEAEAQCHGVALEEVAFHEVGAVDSLVDVAMAAYCVTKVRPRKVFASPVKLGRGLITIDHGTHAVPPPAVARLAVGMLVAPVPKEITRENVELSTPTGLAILKALNPEFVQGWPAGMVLAQGVGAGTMDLGMYPNVFRVCAISEHASTASLPYEADEVIEISVNIDDMTGERLAWVSDTLFSLGALDVWQTPGTGKKNRVMVCLSVLTPLQAWSACADFILKETTTFGIRYRSWNRLKLKRQFEARETPQGLVQYKVGFNTKGERLKEKAEFDDLRKIWDENSKA